MKYFIVATMISVCSAVGLLIIADASRTRPVIGGEWPAIVAIVFFSFCWAAHKKRKADNDEYIRLKWKLDPLPPNERRKPK